MQDPIFNPDPHLDALLDEALSPDSIPGGIPAGLESRILVAMKQNQPTAERTVIARIGFFSSASFKRIAAALLVTASVGFAFMVASNIQNNTNNAIALANQKAAKLAELNLDVQQAPVTTVMAHDNTFALADTSIDHRIDTLKARANDAALTAAVDNWSSVAENLEAELDAMDAEPEKG